jgi:hypothetical protein
MSKLKKPKLINWTQSKYSSTVYTVDYIPHAVHCILYSMYCKQYIIKFTLYSI